MTAGVTSPWWSGRYMGSPGNGREESRFHTDMTEDQMISEHSKDTPFSCQQEKRKAIKTVVQGWSCI